MSALWVAKGNGIPYVYDDGGRAAAGFKGNTGDCGVRAIAIATGQPYLTVYNLVNELCKNEVLPKGAKRGSNARTGLHKGIMHQYMESLGWHWIPTMKFGQGCKVHVRSGELPTKGSLVLNLSRHFAAVVDGVLRDTYDSSRGGTRCVYGYWIKEG